jgi:hypothetical protein
LLIAAVVNAIGRAVKIGCNKILHNPACDPCCRETRAEGPATVSE